MTMFDRPASYTKVLERNIMKNIKTEVATDTPYNACVVLIKEINTDMLAQGITPAVMLEKGYKIKITMEVVKKNEENEIAKLQHKRADIYARLNKFALDTHREHNVEYYDYVVRKYNENIRFLTHLIIKLAKKDEV